MAKKIKTKEVEKKLPKIETLEDFLNLSETIGDEMVIQVHPKVKTKDGREKGVFIEFHFKGNDSIYFQGLIQGNELKDITESEIEFIVE